MFDELMARKEFLQVKKIRLKKIEKSHESQKVIKKESTSRVNYFWNESLLFPYFFHILFRLLMCSVARLSVSTPFKIGSANSVIFHF